MSLAYFLPTDWFGLIDPLVVDRALQTLPSRHIAPLVSIMSGKAAAEDSGEAWTCNQSPPEHGPIYIIELCPISFFASPQIGNPQCVGTPTPPSASSPLERKRDGDSSNLPAAKRQCLSTQECPSAKPPIQRPLKRKRDGNSSNLPVAKRQSLSTQERPSTKSPIQHLLKRKRDGNSSDPPTAKRQCLSTKSPIQRPLKCKGDGNPSNLPATKRLYVLTTQEGQSESLKKQLTLKRPHDDEAEGFAPSKQLRTASPPSILQLPNELLHEIISYVPMEGLKVITQTSCLFMEIAAPRYFVEVDFEVPQPCAFWVAVYPKDCEALLLWRRTRAFSLPENLYFHMMSATDRDLLALNIFFRSLPQFEEISTSVNLSGIFTGEHQERWMPRTYLHRELTFPTLPHFNTEESSPRRYTQPDTVTHMTSPPRAPYRPLAWAMEEKHVQYEHSGQPSIITFLGWTTGICPGDISTPGDSSFREVAQILHS
ncbi:hypothetical protein BU15DRAFT_68483 [Melanogaster broomeanus]|nr:hypothetical protein BU15DRAFT_68483 [Melanogaster broomeanus]